jgi:transcriptional regulator with XRE-family HTH domain
MTDPRDVLGKNIKNYRKLRGFSQETLAEKAGTSTTHIGMIEIGRKFPSAQMLMHIADALGVDTTELFTARAVAVFPVGNISVERLYREIADDFRAFEQTVTAKINALRDCDEMTDC